MRSRNLRFVACGILAATTLPVIAAGDLVAPSAPRGPGTNAEAPVAPPEIVNNLTCGKRRSAEKSADEEGRAKGLSYSIGPLTLAAGPTDDGDFGTSIKGGDTILEGLLVNCAGSSNFSGTKFRPIGRLKYEVDAGWTTAKDSMNSSSVSLRPMLSIHVVDYTQARRATAASPASPLGSLTEEEAATELIENSDTGTFIAPRTNAVVSLFADVRHRFGEVDDGAGGIVRANQFIYGGGLELSWWAASRIGAARDADGPGPLYGFFRDPPRLTAGYYSADDVNGNEAPVPKELEADYVTTTAALHLAMPWFTKPIYKSPLLLNYDYKGSKATSGPDDGYASYHNVQLVYAIDAKAKPVLSYRSGEEQGLEYDRQVILGILWSLVGF